MKRMSVAGYVLTALLLIVTLFHYSIVNRSVFTIGDFVQQPGEYAGELRSITGPFLAPSFAPSSQGFIMELNQHPILVRYTAEHLPPVLGEVSVYGVLEADGSVTAQRIHNYDYNYVLYVLSFLAGLATLGYLLVEWKITQKGVIPKEQKSHQQVKPNA